MALLRSSLLLLITSFLPNTISADELQHLVENSRELIRIFSEQLQSEYAKVIQENNPEQAMKVCRIIAPEIATHLSKDGWNIRRISLDFRNQNNAPDQYEKKILEDFEKKKSEGWSIDQLAYFKLSEIGDQSEFRYLKAIAREEFCLSCHGSNSPEKYPIKSDKPHPNKQAGNYKSDDIYGAYSVKKQETKNYLSEPTQSDEYYTLPEYQEK